MGYKQVVFLNGIEESKNMDWVIIYNFDVVKNALIAAIEMATFDGRGIKINQTLIAIKTTGSIIWFPSLLRVYLKEVDLILADSFS